MKLKSIIRIAKVEHKLSLYQIEGSKVATQFELFAFIITGEELSIEDYYNSI